MVHRKKASAKKPYKSTPAKEKAYVDSVVKANIKKKELENPSHEMAEKSASSPGTIQLSKNRR